MKPTAKIFTWVLIGTALLWTACGANDSKSRPSKRRAGAPQAEATKTFKPELQPSNGKLAGHWIGMAGFDDNVAMNLTIDDARKHMEINALCGNSNDPEIVRSVTIRTNESQMEIQADPNAATNAAKKANATNRGRAPNKNLKKTDLRKQCMLPLKKNTYTYTLDQNDERLNIEIGQDKKLQFCKDVDHGKPSQSCENSITNPNAPVAAPVSDEVAKEEADKLIADEGPLDEKTKAITWFFRTQPDSEYILVQVTGDSYKIEKVCYKKDETANTSKASVSVKAFVTGKRIRILEAKRSEPGKPDPACVVEISKGTIEYSHDVDQKRLVMKGAFEAVMVPSPYSK